MSSRLAGLLIVVLLCGCAARPYPSVLYVVAENARSTLSFSILEEGTGRIVIDGASAPVSIVVMAAHDAGRFKGGEDVEHFHQYSRSAVRDVAFSMPLPAGDYALGFECPVGRGACSFNVTVET